MSLKQRLMNIRTKYRLSLVMWLLSGSALGLGAMYITEYFLIPLFIVTLAIGGYCISLKCPNCGKPVLHNPLQIFGMDFYIWTSRIPKKCTKCGVQLH